MLGRLRLVGMNKHFIAVKELQYRLAVRCLECLGWNVQLKSKVGQTIGDHFAFVNLYPLQDVRVSSDDEVGSGIYGGMADLDLIRRQKARCEM